MKRAHLHFYVDARGEWRWRFRAANGRIVATSGEGYSSREKAEHGWQSLRRAVVSGAWEMTRDPRRPAESSEEE